MKLSQVRGRMPQAERTLDHIEIHGHQDGGRIIEHHFTSGRPESYVFEPHEGQEMIDHLAEHVGIRDDGSMKQGEGPSPADDEAKPNFAEQEGR